MSNKMKKMDEIISDDLETIINFRREVHQFPELSYHEFETTERILSLLEMLPGEVHTRQSGIGCWIDIGPKDQPRVAIRGDIDALAIKEATKLPFESLHCGIMHACGHDVHASCAMGTAFALAKAAPEQSFRILFQPAEEATPGGAIGMIEDGVLEGVKAILSLHCDPSRPVGVVGLRKGALTAANDPFTIHLSGTGGHGARPHLTNDMILISAQIIQAIQHMFDRRVDAREPFVISFGAIQAGSFQSPNVIPSQCKFSGTIRSVGKESRDLIQERFHEVLSGMCSAMGISYELDLVRGAPAVINDSMLIDSFAKSAKTILGEDGLEWIALPSMGGEDFAYYTQLIPGAMIRLGTGVGPALHTPQFQVDEKAIPIAIRLLSETAIHVGKNL